MRRTKLNLARLQVCRSDNRQIQSVPLLCSNDLLTEQFYMVSFASAERHIDLAPGNSQPLKFGYNPKYRIPVSIIHIKTHELAAPLTSIHAYRIFLFQVVLQDAVCLFAVCTVLILGNHNLSTRKTQHVPLSIGHILISQPIQPPLLLIGHQHTSILTGVYNIL